MTDVKFYSLLTYVLGSLMIVIGLWAIVSQIVEGKLTFSVLFVLLLLITFGRTIAVIALKEIRYTQVR